MPCSKEYPDGRRRSPAQASDQKSIPFPGSIRGQHQLLPRRREKRCWKRFQDDAVPVL